MLMVIFGAGASYDSFARYPPESGAAMGWRPPLANQLFGERFGPYIQQFRQMHAVVPDLQNPAVGVETVLEGFQSEAPTYLRRLNQLAAVRYYLQSMLSSCQSNWENETSGVTNYKALLDRIDQRVRGVKLLVSFNYDTLLEEALESTLDLKIERITDYVRTEYQVVKLHGSINWAHKILGPTIDLTGSPTDVASRVINKAPELDVYQAFDLVPRHQLARAGDRAIIPALTIPVATKSVYECPQEQQLTMMQALPNVDKILVIGWKAGEKRFLDTLVERLKQKLRIMVISSGEKKALELAAELSKLRKARSDTHFDVGKKGFSHAITSHEVDEFLKAG